jgi:hypothetical protein
MNMKAVTTKQKSSKSVWEEVTTSPSHLKSLAKIKEANRIVAMIKICKGWYNLMVSSMKIHQKLTKMKQTSIKTKVCSSLRRPWRRLFLRMQSRSFSNAKTYKQLINWCLMSWAPIKVSETNLAHLIIKFNNRG